MSGNDDTPEIRTARRRLAEYEELERIALQAYQDRQRRTNGVRERLEALVRQQEAADTRQAPRDDCGTPGCQPTMGMCVFARCVWDTGSQEEHN